MTRVFFSNHDAKVLEKYTGKPTKKYFQNWKAFTEKDGLGYWLVPNVEWAKLDKVFRHKFIDKFVA